MINAYSLRWFLYQSCAVPVRVMGRSRRYSNRAYEKTNTYYQGCNRFCFNFHVFLFSPEEKDFSLFQKGDDNRRVFLHPKKQKMPLQRRNRPKSKNALKGATPLPPGGQRKRRNASLHLRGCSHHCCRKSSGFTNNVTPFTLSDYRCKRRAALVRRKGSHTWSRKGTDRNSSNMRSSSRAKGKYPP